MSRMPCLVLALVSLPLLAPRAAEAEPLTPADVVRLAEGGVGEQALSALVTERGITPSLGVDDLIALAAAGLPDPFIARLVRAAAPAGSPLHDAAVEVRDGVVVVTGRGAAGMAGEPELAVTPAGVEAEPSVAPPPTVVVNVSPLEAAPVATHAAPDNFHPTGAVFGPTGGAVFLPAAYGPQPSSFGKTIVSVTAAPLCWPSQLASPVIVLSPQPPARTESYDRIPIRTSRGTIWVPN